MTPPQIVILLLSLFLVGLCIRGLWIAGRISVRIWTGRCEECGGSNMKDDEGAARCRDCAGGRRV